MGWESFCSFDYSIRNIHYRWVDRRLSAPDFPRRLADRIVSLAFIGFSKEEVIMRIFVHKTFPFIANLSTAGRYEFFIPIRDWNFLLKISLVPKIDDRKIRNLIRGKLCFILSSCVLSQARKEMEFAANRIINGKGSLSWRNGVTSCRRRNSIKERVQGGY